MKTWHAALVGIMLLLTFTRPTLAEIPAASSQPLSNLVFLFPNFAQLPAGMVLAEEGSRSAAEIAASFRDPIDAAQVLSTWGWTFNTFRTYVAGPGAGPEYTGSPRGFVAPVCFQHRGRLCPAVFCPWPGGDAGSAGRTGWILASVRGGGHWRSGSHAVPADRGFAGASDLGDAQLGSRERLLLGAGFGDRRRVRGTGKCWRIRARA